MLVFCCIFGRVCPLSCRRSGDPSGRGHVVVPRGRARSGLPARASLAHSDPLVSSSVAFCWALRRVRRSWGRYIRPQEWTLGSKSRAVAVNSRATLLLSDGASCLTAASYVRLTPSCVVTLCDLSKICTIAVPATWFGLQFTSLIVACTLVWSPFSTIFAVFFLLPKRQ